MALYAYAAADLASLKSAAPAAFEPDPEGGEDRPKRPAIVRERTKGVWLARPVFSEPDPETGEREILTPGTRSPGFVIFSPRPIAGLEAFQIQPAGDVLA